MGDHQVIDRRSLEFDRRIVARLRENPALVGTARANLRRWLETASPAARRTLREWQALLDGPFAELLATMEGEDERSTRLRQSSPFCGVLSRDERLAILKRFQDHDAHSA
jgi:hypothetical protein